MTVRWGVMGTGGIANAFADALGEVPDAELAAVGSRTFDKAFTFADHHEVGHPFGSYEELVACPEVDVVYVGTPASHHYRHARMALEAGKHVLVEKPFTANAAQALELQYLAKERQRFLMEAMWPRFTPAYRTLADLLDRHVIGDVRAVMATFGGRADFAPRTRPFRLDLAGGALMDGAVYGVSLAQMVLNLVTMDVHAIASIGESGVDEQVMVTMRGVDGELSVATGGIRTTFNSAATIYGTDGMIVLPSLIAPPWLRIDRPGRDPEVHSDFPARHRLAWQVDEVHRQLAFAAQTGIPVVASPTMSWQSSCEVMRALDMARAAIGLRFPDDVEAL